MHDTISLENLGIPAVAIATSEFITPARVQASALGRPEFEAIYVAHPIQDQTPAQIAARADAVVLDIVGRLTESAVEPSEPAVAMESRSIR